MIRRTLPVSVLGGETSGSGAIAELAEKGAQVRPLLFLV
jgi:hypothetical protein